jgi:hypothetical protein
VNLQLPLRKQECRFTTLSQDAGMQCSGGAGGGMGYSLICLWSPDPTTAFRDAGVPLK